MQSAAHSQDGRRSLHDPVSAGLLNLQIHFLAAVAGIWVIHQPFAAMGAAASLFVLTRFVFQRRISIILFFFAFLIGYGYAELRMPETPERPAWASEAVKTRLQGTVVSVEPKPAGKLRMILENVSGGMEGERRALPGRVAWTWMHPLARPIPGDDVELTGWLRPVRGFLNHGNWDFRFYWARKGVFSTVYTYGERGDVVSTPPAEPSWGYELWTARETLRQRFGDALSGLEGRGKDLLPGLFFGDRMRLQAEDMEALRAGSVVHSLALSGLHVGLAASLGFAAAFGVGMVVHQETQWVAPILLVG